MDLSALTGMFVGLHAMAARAIECPELELTPDEGEAFMAAAQSVMRHYSVAATQKTLDWIALMGVVSGIYGPRIFAIHMRRKAEAANDGRPNLPSDDGQAVLTPTAEGHRFAA